MAQGLNINQSPNIQFARHPDDEPLNSSINEVENLTETHVWEDMEQLIEDRIELLTQALVQAEDEEDIRRLQGEIQGWQHALELPTMLATYIEHQQEA